MYPFEHTHTHTHMQPYLCTSAGANPLNFESEGDGLIGDSAGSLRRGEVRVDAAYCDTIGDFVSGGEVRPP